MRPLPGWLIFLLFVPFQIFLFFKIFETWRWWTILLVLTLGFLGNRAARAPWITALVLPGQARRHERRRHVYQGILLLAAALSWLLPTSAVAPPYTSSWPQPWLPLAFLASLLKAALR